ncbi:MAG: triose-phosphate isomerase [Bacteroidota bacterium]
MRKKTIAGNWKMYTDIHESADLVKGLKEKVQNAHSALEVVLCPPFTSLVVVGSLIKSTRLKLGAQNMYHEDEGAYTGEVSAKMLKSTGCQYVILGHSERRQYFHETNDLINLKVKKALAIGLTPIVCVGERLDEREKGVTERVVSAQVKGVLRDLRGSEIEKLIIAYEPVWAIGTGRNATPEQAEEVHQLIRKLVGQLNSWAVAERLIIQYGGSVKPGNAEDLLCQPNIDGALVGGASLKGDSFGTIIRAAEAILAS